MKAHTRYLTFNTKKRRELQHITPQVAEAVRESGIQEGFVLVHHEVIVPITAGRLDLGAWQRIFYAEFDGQRPKRVIIKAMGE